MRKDVLIAGAGLAGSALAIALGRRGVSVALFERAAFPREKPCGEGLMPGGVTALEELGISTGSLGAPFHGIRYHFGGHSAAGSFPRESPGARPGLGVRRRDLDSALAQLAAETTGVDLRTSVRITGPLFEHGRVAGLLVEDQPVRARLTIAADGAHSRLRHALGLDVRLRCKRVGMRMHFREPAGALAQSHVEIFMGFGHELYVTPLPRGEFLVAALAESSAMHGPAEAQFARWWQAQPLLADRIRGSEPAGELLVTSPLTGRASRRVLPGFALLGDAAGFTDPLTGGGMTQALQSARLLAARLAASPEWNLSTLSAFDRDREALLRDYRRVTAGVLWLSHHPALIAPALAVVRAAPRLLTHLLAVTGGDRRLLRGSAQPFTFPASARAA